MNGFEVFIIFTFCVTVWSRSAHQRFPPFSHPENLMIEEPYIQCNDENPVLVPAWAKFPAPPVLAMRLLIRWKPRQTRLGVRKEKRKTAKA